MEAPDNDPEDPDQSAQEDERLKNELAFLFGQETVELAGQLDIANLNFNDKMIDSIAAGVKKLKELRDDPGAQLHLIKAMDQGSRLLLCMWIMDLNLLDKIQNGSYIKNR